MRRASSHTPDPVDEFLYKNHTCTQDLDGLHEAVCATRSLYKLAADCRSSLFFVTILLSLYLYHAFSSLKLIRDSTSFNPLGRKLTVTVNP